MTSISQCQCRETCIMYLLGLAVLCLAAMPVTPSHEIHKRMTADEIQQIFHTTPDTVPNYEMVEVHVSNVQKRDTRSRRSIRIKAFDGDINLWLEPTEGSLVGEDTPVMLSSFANQDFGVRFTPYPGIMKYVGQLLQDTRTASSLVVSQDDRQRYSVNGFIGSENLIVRSLPESLCDDLSKSFYSVDDFDSSRNTSYHVIFKVKNQDFEKEYKNHPLNQSLLESRVTRRRRAIPEVIYPEILIAVDYSTYIFHGSDPVRVLRYLLPLWNSVDLKFRSLESPRIRLNIARVVIATDPRATPYMKLIERNSDLVDAQGVLDESGLFFYAKRHNIPLQSYDILMVMTRLQMLAEGSPALGLGIPGGACSEGRSRINKNGVFQDNGSYDSWAPAHELGHLLGAHHDGVRCPSQDGYIMTPGALSTSHSWDFSPCSLSEMQQFLHTEPRCLYNVPRTAGRRLPRIRPGRLMSLDEQCRFATGTGACKLDVLEPHELCLYLSCEHKSRNDVCTLQYGHGPADGTPCGNGHKFCFRGECIGQ